MTVGIVGLGLIGGSIGLALRDPQRRILGFDIFDGNKTTALSRGCIDEAVPLDDLARSDLVFIATPPQAVPNAVAKILEHCLDGTVITDCASVKSEVMRALRDAGTLDRRYVGGHPMAGHEKSGPSFSTAWLFRGARWILTPDKTTLSSAVKTVEKAVKAMGATPVRMDPVTHDRHVALLSHVPHLLAAALVTLAEDLDTTEASAGSWKDLTRVGGVDPNLWTQIFAGNRTELSKVLEDLELELGRVREALERNDIEAVRSFMERARKAKARHDH